jgi:cellulose synthase operon protein C
VWAAKNDTKKAEDAFQKALQADPEYAPAYFHYAAALSKGGQAGEKVKTLSQEYLKREPKGEFAADAQRL